MSSGSISTLGVGSGLDLQGIIDKLRAVDQKSITNQETKKTGLQEKIQEFNKINADLLSMKSNALNLSLGSNFLNRKISSSGDSVTATSLSSAKVMSHSMEVTSLASHSAWNSNGVAAKTDSVATADGTFSFKLGATGSAVEFDVPAGTTLQGLADLINDSDSNPGVSVTIADTGVGATPFRLVLTSDKTGEDNRIFMSSQLTELGLTESGGAFHAPPTSDTSTGYKTTITSDSQVVADPIAITAATNDEIVFRETLADGTLGPQLTATIPPLVDYTPDALATAMETAMEAASLAGGNEIDYTVSFDSVEKKFSITENGSSLHNLTMEWTSSSSAADLGFDAVTDTFDTIDITALNNGIVFREKLSDGTLGGQLTATIPVLADYTPDSLATAMETAMEAASLAGGNEIDYTVSFDRVEKKFTIMENGSNLHELSMEWGNSSAAADLGFNLDTDTYKPYDSILNARFNVDSISYQRQSNTGLDDVIQGVTLDMTATGTASISVTNDFDDIKTGIQELVETLNGLRTEIDAQNVYDLDTQTQGLLFGENSINRIDDELSSFLGNSITTNSSIKNLFDLGFEIKRDGSFSLNEKLLNSILASSPEDVQKFFIGDLENNTPGFGDLLNEKLRDYTDSQGLLTAETDKSQAQIDRITSNIANDTKKIDKRYEIMTRQFTQLDIYMRQMTAQSDFLKQIFEPDTTK